MATELDAWTAEGNTEALVRWCLQDLQHKSPDRVDKE